MQFQLFVVFLPVFVADTKITFGYNLVAPLTKCIGYLIKHFELIKNTKMCFSELCEKDDSVTVHT